jgi:hypothetical protein
MRRRRRPIEDLRTAIDCLPVHTRVAMLEGVRRWSIIVGAYTDRRGGVCPMLAAHRCGGRTDFRSFARAWDRFTRAGRKGRRATDREIRTLAAQLEGSLWRDEEILHELRKAMEAESPAGEAAGASAAAKRRNVGAWLLPFRRWDGYREAVDAATRQLERRDDQTPAPDAQAAEREPTR